MPDGTPPGNPGSNRPAGSPVAGCVGTLIVNVHWGNDANAGTPYMKDSRVKVGGVVAIALRGPSTQNVTTTTGTHTFRDIPCGDYAVGVAVDETNALVDRAKEYVGSTRWAYAPSITSLDGELSLPGRTNKCNFFIYDMIQQTYGSAPTYTYGRGGSWSPIRKTVPDLAGSWATNDNSASDPTEGWRNIDYRPPRGTPVAPGSILAIAANYSDATGHVGIVSYPEPANATQAVRGSTHTVTVVMQGQTISATGAAVVENNWGFRTSDKKETNSLNSPAAGVEVRR
ncbi:hypothetical protein [Jannaschia pohangensis]|uniref:CHAP domain-containing protein n=1 Tax=Jannaschia pohangensis TaxID=390807 RepID=A0A1I3SB99_9RHOB|nr:hypothetical protein [Jannaschia pohangensis]SFJ54889.1 hypothetical protein SAMN04488095_3054 [Jannaschia pohangensis]